MITKSNFSLLCVIVLARDGRTFARKWQLKDLASSSQRAGALVKHEFARPLKQPL